MNLMHRRNKGGGKGGVCGTIRGGGGLRDYKGRGGLWDYKGRGGSAGL